MKLPFPAAQDAFCQSRTHDFKHIQIFDLQQKPARTSSTRPAPNNTGPLYNFQTEKMSDGPAAILIILITILCKHDAFLLPTIIVGGSLDLVYETDNAI